MLQKTADDGRHADVLAHAGDAGPQHAEAAHDQVDLDARLRGRQERLADAAVLQLVQLGDDSGGPPGPEVGDLPVDQREEPVAHGNRGDQQLGVIALERPAGQVVEQVGHVVGQRRVAGEQAEVGVEPGRLHVVVAGADVGVTAQPVVVLAHHQRRLAVGLESDHPVDDVDAGLLQRFRQVQVRLLVEAGGQLDQAGRLLARLGGGGQCVEKGRVAADAVDGHLDGQNLGILGGAADELGDAGVEALVGVVDQQVAGPDHGEQVGVVLGQGRRRHGLPGRSFSSGRFSPAI